MQNCLIKPVFALRATSSVLLRDSYSGNVTIEGCTFDLSGITGNSAIYFQQAFIQRMGALNLTFRNNAYVVPSGENFPLLYGALATRYADLRPQCLQSRLRAPRSSATTATSTGFAHLRAVADLGEDCINSTLNANLLLQTDMPQSGSPLLNAGVDFGSRPM